MEMISALFAMSLCHLQVTNVEYRTVGFTKWSVNSAEIHLCQEFFSCPPHGVIQKKTGAAKGSAVKRMILTPHYMKSALPRPYIIAFIQESV